MSDNPTGAPGSSDDGDALELLEIVPRAFSAFNREEAIRLNAYSLSVDELNGWSLGTRSR